MTPPPPLPAADAPGGRSWTLRSPEGPVDVEVVADGAGTVSDVLGALRTELGFPARSLWSGPVPLPGTTPLSAPALRHGAVLGLDSPAAEDPAAPDGDGSPPGRTPGRGAGGGPGGALELHVVGGPDAGRVLPLPQGRLVLGRGAGCSVALADPGVSRRHLLVTARGGAVSATDLGSANGSRLRGPDGRSERLGPDATPWPVGAVLTLGSTTIRLTGPLGVPLHSRPAAAGREQVRPLRGPDPVVGEVTVDFPADPPQRSRRRLGWVAVAVPGVAGLLVAWLLDTPQFLVLALLGPVVAVGSWLSDRVSGRRDGRRSVAEHRVATAEAERRLAATVAAARAALEEAHPDPATLAAAVRRLSSPLWSRSGDGTGALTVRLGTGPGPTTVSRGTPDGRRTPVVGEQLPVPVDLELSGGLGIAGPRTPATGVARAVLLQLAALLPPTDLGVVVAAAPDRLADWRWTEWLPHLVDVVPLGGEGAPVGGSVLPAAGVGPSGGDGTGRAGARPPARLVVLDADVPPEAVAALVEGRRVLCVTVAASEGRLPFSPAACLTVAGETGTQGRLRQPGQPVDRELTLDSVPLPVAAATARSLAGLAGPDRAGGLPDASRLLDLAGGGHPDAGSGAIAGGWSRDRGALVCVVGEDDRGPVRLDLCAQGPHALVAGTTGSGKSELLQTLVAGLALNHPPDRLTFLLVDYKGGAAFADAARLPHTVGLLTDLDPSSTGRALRSLTAELTRRERVLAGHGTPDVADLPDAVLLPRLVIVVDEFATLAEDLPGFVSGLVGIAQRGRSLGVHLVLATQRPSGVVSPEIRANCSLRICLRTTDEGDSRDVLGSPLAGSLPVRLPGRAYLRTGEAPPALLQVARVAGGPAPRPPGGVRVRRWSWPAVLLPPPAEAAAAPPGGSDLARIVEALVARSAQRRIDPPGRPWLPPLPEHLPAEELDRWAGPDTPDTELRIGLLDSPDTQSQEPLVLDLAVGGGWLLVGGPRSGRTTALRSVLREGVRGLPPARLQVHVLDHGGGGLGAEAARLPHTGTAVGRDDPYRSERLVARLQAAVDQRRVGAPADRPHLLLLVDGAESVSTQLDDADPGGGSAALLRLVREGAAAGLTCVLTADRAVPGSRLAAAVGARLVLPLPDRADYAVAGVPPRAVPGARPPGRALLGEDAAECQLVLPRQQPASGAGVPDHPPAPDVIAVVPLPADPVEELPTPAALTGGLWLPVGPGGDDGAPAGIDLLRSGGLLVVGPPGSGRSCALAAFSRHCRHAGADVLHLGDAPAATREPGALAGERRVAVDEVAFLEEWVTRSRGVPAVVVADDVTALPEATADAVAALAGPGRGLVVLAAGSAPDLAGTFRGPTVALRRSRTALLLRPGPGDAQVLGLRLPRVPLPARPGSGWLVVAGSATRVQVARRRVAAAQSSSSTGPISCVAYQASS